MIKKKKFQLAPNGTHPNFNLTYKSPLSGRNLLKYVATTHRNPVIGARNIMENHHSFTKTKSMGRRFDCYRKNLNYDNKN